MTPYEKETTVTTTASNEIVEIPLPGRFTIERIAVVRIGGGSISVTPFNRAFTGEDVMIRHITETADGKCLLTMMSPGTLHVRAGDQIVLTPADDNDSNSLTSLGEPETHRVTRVTEDAVYVETDVDFADVVPAHYVQGLARLSIPTAEEPLYQVTAAAITGTNAVVSSTSLVYVNLDPLPTRNIGVKRKIYFRVATADTYKFSIRGRESVAYGG